jgi:Tfp pilus assembly PilM family ATPase
VIESVAFVEHSKSLTYAANDAEQKGIIAETLRTFLKSSAPKTDRVCLGLPGRMSLARYAELPKVSDGKAKKLIDFEAPYQFPIPIAQLDWDYHIFEDWLPGEDQAKSLENQGRRALLVGVQRHAIDQFVEPFRLVGLRADLLQPDFIALHNFVAYETFPQPTAQEAKAASPAVGAIDIGGDVTNLVVSSPQSLWFHGCGVAGQSLTRTLVWEYKWSLAQAEQAKRAPESVDCLSEFYDSLTPVFEDLAKELQKSLGAYAEQRPDRPVQRLYCSGGGFLLHGLFRFLRSGR